ncbi:MAG: MFS transporter [Phycisphaerae bacterium]
MPHSWYTSPVFYGWIILGIAMVATVATSPGQSFLVGKFKASLETALGIDEPTLTLTYGVATFLAAIPLLFVGPLADRLGPRIIMGASAIVLGMACWAIGYVTGPITLGFCYFLLRFAGQGVLGLSASHSTAMWFDKQLGTVTGFKSFAMPVAMLILPPIVTMLIDAQGWRFAFAMLGTAVWISVLPLVIFFHRNRPEDIGQSVDGERSINDASAIQAKNAANECQTHPHAHPEAELVASSALEQPLPIDPEESPDEEVCFTRGQALQTSAYWILTAAMVMNALIGTAFVFLLAELTEQASLPNGYEDRLLAVFAVCMAAFSPIAGRLTDTTSPRWLVTMASSFLGSACFCFAIANGYILAWTGMVLLAASQALIFVSGSTLFARFFGRPHHGSIRASVSFSMVVGTSMGPYLTAVLARQWGYDGAMWIFAIGCLPVALAGLACQPPTPLRQIDTPTRNK